MEPTALFSPERLRRTAALTLLLFLWAVLHPAFAAAARAAPPAPAAPAGPPPAQASALDGLRELARRADAKARRGEDSRAEKAKLLRGAEGLDAEDRQAEAEFAAALRHIEAHKLPAEIKQRHARALADYRAKMQALRGHLDGLRRAEARRDAVGEARSLGGLAAFLAKEQKGRRHQFDDPGNLPNRGFQPDPGHKPRESEQAFKRAGLFDNPAPKLAGLGDFTFAHLPGANDPAYLAETDEIKLAPAVRAKAAELGHDPVKIHNWVRNNVQWQPTWGAGQDAALTLSARRGNALDIAGLLIALLRASGIPSRYVHGTIEVQAEAFKNWAGGFSDILGAANFASAGGVPITAVASGGQVASVRLEHVWVEAAIDYLPSRGAVNRDADAWVPLDPSYKQYQALPGLDPAAIAGVDLAAAAQTTLASAAANDAEGWVSGLDPAALRAAQAQMQTALQSYVGQHFANPTVGDVLGGRRTVAQELPILPGSLPYREVAVGARYGALPAALQNTLAYAFGRDAQGGLADPLALPLAKINNRRLVLSFKPATAADEQALQSLLPQGQITDLSQLPQSIPAYLVQVVPELKLDGEVVKTGSAMRLGGELDFLSRLTHAGRALPANSYAVVAGSYLAVAADSGNISPEALQAARDRLGRTRDALAGGDPAAAAALTREDLLGDLFHAGLLGYYAQLAGMAHAMGLRQHAHHILAAGMGTYGYEPAVSYFFGVPRALKPGGAAMNLPMVHVAGQGANDGARKRDYLFQVGLLSSALEHAVPEQMFTSAQSPGEAISAVKALQKANAAGQRIYRLTQANQAAALPAIHHDALVMQEIQDALAAGKEVITHTDAVAVPGWSGAGYILYDPQTGDGAFKIGGGANGAFLLVGEIHGSAIEYTLFYMNAALTANATPYAVASLGVLSVELLVVIGTYKYYGMFYTEDAQACYLAGIGAGLLAAGVTNDIMEKIFKVEASSLLVKLISRAIGVAMLNLNASPVPGCEQ